MRALALITSFDYVLRIRAIGAAGFGGQSLP